MKCISRMFIPFTLMLLTFTSCSKQFEKLSATELLDFGEKYLLEMNYEQAIVYFNRLIEVEPRNPRGYTDLAKAYVGQGEIEKAVGVLRQGLDVLPDNSDILALLADLELHTQQTIESTPSPNPTPTPSEEFGIESDEITITATLIDNAVEYASQYEQYKAEYETKNRGILIRRYGFRFDPPLTGINGVPVYEAAVGDTNIKDTDLKWYEELPGKFNGLKVFIAGTLTYDEDYQEIPPPELEWDIGGYQPNGPYEFNPERFEIIDPSFN